MGRCQCCGCPTYDTTLPVDETELPEGARPVGAAFLQITVVLCIDCCGLGLLYAAKHAVAERDAKPMAPLARFWCPNECTWSAPMPDVIPDELRCPRCYTTFPVNREDAPSIMIIPPKSAPESP
jgi:hypothetical protein